VPNTTLGADIEKELHDLCQPLTNLSCFLELGQMMGDPDSMKTSVDGALVECRRMFESIANMRRRLNEILDEAAEREAPL
jgi:signal transduction histidine kinase